jgi:GDSL-like lipase/acylhydrolase family protein
MVTRLGAWIGALALIALSTGIAPSAQASGGYVALGDSYASGVGTRTYDDASGSCYRSPKAYPVLDAERIGLTLRFKACSGASVPEVRSGQLGPLGATTTRVSVQVGGNDAGFSNVITTCAQPSWAADCDAAVDRAQAFIADKLGPRLDNLYADIDALAPNARVVVVGYPRLFNGQDCNAGTWFGAGEMTRLNQTADQLNAKIRNRADAAGFGFVDPTTAFVGHAVCSDAEWVNGLSSPTRESYHPNVRGQRAYADLVDDALL